MKDHPDSASYLKTESSPINMRSDALQKLSEGAARREADKPDFEDFTRKHIFLRIDSMLDDLAENIVNLSVDDAVDDLLAAKNEATVHAISQQKKAVASANYYKEFEKSEAKRRHNMILDLRKQLAERTKEVGTKERKILMRPHENARSLRHLLKSFLRRILEMLGQRPPP